MLKIWAYIRSLDITFELIGTVLKMIGFIGITVFCVIFVVSMSINVIVDMKGKVKVPWEKERKEKHGK